MFRPSLAGRAALLLLPLLLLACGDDTDAPAETDDEAPEVVVSVERDIQSLPRSEITLGTAAASAGGSGTAARSTATASTVRSSNASVQRVFSEFNARQTAEGVVLTLPEAVLFDFDEATLRPDAQDALGKIEQVLGEYADAPVQVVGHTDSKGDDAYNQDLSGQRAQAVVAWLIEHGAPPRGCRRRAGARASPWRTTRPPTEPTTRRGASRTGASRSCCGASGARAPASRRAPSPRRRHPTRRHRPRPLRRLLC